MGYAEKIANVWGKVAEERVDMQERAVDQIRESALFSIRDKVFTFSIVVSIFDIFYCLVKANSVPSRREASRGSKFLTSSCPPLMDG